MLKDILMILDKSILVEMLADAYFEMASDKRANFMSNMDYIFKNHNELFLEELSKVNKNLFENNGRLTEED